MHNVAFLHKPLTRENCLLFADKYPSHDHNQDLAQDLPEEPHQDPHQELPQGAAAETIVNNVLAEEMAEERIYNDNRLIID